MRNLVRRIPPLSNCQFELHSDFRLYLKSDNRKTTGWWVGINQYGFKIYDMKLKFETILYFQQAMAPSLLILQSVLR